MLLLFSIVSTNKSDFQTFHLSLLMFWALTVFLNAVATDKVSLIQSETCVRSSSHSHLLLTSFCCCFSSWLYLLFLVRMIIFLSSFPETRIIKTDGMSSEEIWFSLVFAFHHILCLLQASASSPQTPLTRYVESFVSLTGVYLSSAILATLGWFFSLCQFCVHLYFLSWTPSSHHSTSTLWRTALSACLCCWLQQSKHSSTHNTAAWLSLHTWHAL